MSNNMDLIEYAWGIIANVSGGDWDSQAETWRYAAEKWRDQYHELLSEMESDGTIDEAPNEQPQ